MATVNGHLSVDQLEERYVACSDATAARHFQAIWLLARGQTVSQVSATTAFGERWIEQLLARYNAEGAASEEPEISFTRRNGLKNLADALAEEAANHPGKPIEVFATDEHRIGLKIPWGGG